MDGLTPPLSSWLIRLVDVLTKEPKSANVMPFSVLRARIFCPIEKINAFNFYSLSEFNPDGYQRINANLNIYFSIQAST